MSLFPFLFNSVDLSPSFLKQNSIVFVTGTIKQQKKKTPSMKEGKKPHPHAQMGPAQPGLPPQVPPPQPSSQMKQQQQRQPSPEGFMAPPPVAPLESSQLLETNFETLPQFNQPLLLMNNTGNSSSPAPPHLNPHSAEPVSPETHPFLNQHPILPSPGKSSGADVGFLLV